MKKFLAAALIGAVLAVPVVGQDVCARYGRSVGTGNTTDFKVENAGQQMGSGKQTLRTAFSAAEDSIRQRGLRDTLDVLMWVRTWCDQWVDTSGVVQPPPIDTLPPPVDTLPPPVGGPYGPGANAPAGLVHVALDMDGTSLTPSPLSASFTGQLYGAPRWTVVADPTAPTGSALRHTRFAGDRNDEWLGMFEIGNWRGQLSDFSEIYVRAHVLFSPNWFSHGGGGEKIINLMFGATNNSEIHLLHNNGQITLREVGQGGDNPQFKSGTFAGGQWNQGSQGWSPPGQWTEVELHMVAQSGPGAADGSVRLWMNGVEVLPFEQWAGGERRGDASAAMWRWAANANPPGFRGIQFGEYRGGSGGSPIPADMFTQWGGIYVAGKP